MRRLEVLTRSPEETQRLGELIGKLAAPGDVYLLIGNLGAGKTCLTQGIARGLGINDYVLSPTFVIVREMPGRLPLYHIDLYRLDRLEESIGLGLDEYFYGRGVSVVEWAEKAPGILPVENLTIRINYTSETGRRLELVPSGRRYLRLLAGLERLTQS